MSYQPNKKIGELIRDEKEYLLAASGGNSSILGLSARKLAHSWLLPSLVDRQNSLLKRLELEL